MSAVRGLRVAIVGAGIGGLTTARTLREFGHDPIVLEQTAELRPIGAGLSLWPNGIKVLNLIGLGAAVAQLGGHMDRMAYADRDGNQLQDFSLSELYERVGERAWPVERAALQELLLDEVGRDTVHLGVRATSVTETAEGVSVATSDGVPVEADLVVAADGTHSWFRDYIVGRPIRRRYVGYVNWNGLVDQTPEIAPIGTWLTWVGEGKRASVMPVGAGKSYWFFDAPMPIAASERLGPPREALRSEFAGWGSAVQTLIDRLDADRVARIPIHDIPRLPAWRRGRVVLLGDAAHSMSPDLGQGGCQAIEDAWVLTHHLTATSRGVIDALDRYQAERLPHTAAIMRRARRRADIIHGRDPVATEAWYRQLATDGHAGIIDGLAQSVETGPCR
jgi:FAD-dependent urate hydroxylase